MKTALLLATLFAVGCDGDDGGGKREKLDAGSWMLVTWNDSSELSGKVYLQLNEDGSFALYQSIDQPGFETFTGTYRISEGVFSGKYSTGELWESTYDIRTHTDKDFIIASKTDGVVSAYRAATIPDYVREASSGVRSAASVPFL